MQTLLSIAGYDPSSGAGVTADLMVFAAHGLFGTSCITALTVQSTVGVRRVIPVSSLVVGETLECLEEDMPPAGIKIGMLGTSDNVAAVCGYLERLRAAGRTVPIIVDPVLQSSSGAALLDEAGIRRLCPGLVGLADWVTPNTGELELLSKTAVRNQEDMEQASRLLQEQVFAATGRRPGILAKGGHMAKPDDFLLDESGRETWLAGERVQSRSSHGTGCALSSAFLSELVLGRSPEEAAHRAKKYVAEALQTAVPLGRGSGPINHLWKRLQVRDSE